MRSGMSPAGPGTVRFSTLPTGAGSPAALASIMIVCRASATDSSSNGRTPDAATWSINIRHWGSSGMTPPCVELLSASQLGHEAPDAGGVDAPVALPVPRLRAHIDPARARSLGTDPDHDVVLEAEETGRRDGLDRVGIGIRDSPGGCPLGDTSRTSQCRVGGEGEAEGLQVRAAAPLHAGERGRIREVTTRVGGQLLGVVEG